MADITISIGGTDPAQQTVTAGGSYTVAIAALTANPTITFSGPSAFTLDGISALTTGYTIEAVDGAVLTIANLAAVATAATLIVTGASTIVLDAGISALSGIAATFAGAGGTLLFAPGLLSALDTLPTVTGFAPGNHLDLGTAFTAGETAVYSAATGIVRLLSDTGTTLGALHLVGTYLPSAFSVGMNAAGQAEIELACFLRGTLIATPGGEVAVEQLRAEDLVITASGKAVPVTAVRRRSLDGNAADRFQPVCIRAGALGPAVPERDLYVSPDHALYLDSVLIPAGLLINGQSIVKAKLGRPIEYVHVEVDPHAILIANGAPTESYLDIGHRTHFAQANTVTLLPAADPKTWDDACAPLVLTGTLLDRVRYRLCARALVYMADNAGLLDLVA